MIPYLAHLILHLELVDDKQRFAARQEHLGLPGGALLRREDAPGGWGAFQPRVDEPLDPPFAVRGRGCTRTRTCSRSTARYWRLSGIPPVRRDEGVIALWPAFDLEELVRGEEDEHPALVDAGVGDEGILADVVCERVLRVDRAGGSARRC